MRTRVAQINEEKNEIMGLAEKYKLILTKSINFVISLENLLVFCLQIRRHISTSRQSKFMTDIIITFNEKRNHVYTN